MVTRRKKNAQCERTGRAAQPHLKAIRKPLGESTFGKTGGWVRYGQACEEQELCREASRCLPGTEKARKMLKIVVSIYVSVTQIKHLKM